MGKINNMLDKWYIKYVATPILAVATFHAVESGLEKLVNKNTTHKTHIGEVYAAETNTKTSTDYENIAKKMEELNKKGKYQQVIDSYAAFVSANNKNALYFNELGSAYIMTNQIEKGYQSMKKAVSLSTDLTMLYNLAGLSFRTKRYSEAKELAVNYLERTDENKDKFVRQRKIMQKVYKLSIQKL